MISIGLLLLLRGCFGLFYLKVTHLSEEDLKWVTNNKDMSGVMVSSKGDRAKIYTYSYWIANDKNPIYFSWSGGSNYKEANAGYRFRIHSGLLKKDGSFRIQKSANEDVVYANGFLGNLYNDSLKLTDAKSITIGSRVFNDCFIIDDFNGHNNSTLKKDDPNRVCEFILSKKYGPIYFRLVSGEEYFREFK